MSLFKKMEAAGVVPVAVIDRVEDAVPLADAIREGGLEILEITLRTEAALDAIEAIRWAYPEMTLGAGTILDAEVLEKLVKTGVNFGVSPGLNEEVVREAERLELPLTPGVVTPSEVERARARGCRVLKYFPAEASGGVKMLKALSGPYAHTGIRFIPTGGINASNMGAYLEIPSVLAVGGSWFVDRKLVREGKFEKITQLTREAVSLAGRSGR